MWRHNPLDRYNQQDYETERAMFPKRRPCIQLARHSCETSAYERTQIREYAIGLLFLYQVTWVKKRARIGWDPLRSRHLLQWLLKICGYTESEGCTVLQLSTDLRGRVIFSLNKLYSPNCPGSRNAFNRRVSQNSSRYLNSKWINQPILSVNGYI